MLRVSVLYPNEPGKKFDWEYYLNRHVATVDKLLTPLGMLRSEVDKGLGSGQPDAPPPYIAMGHMYFDSLDDFQKALAAHGEELTTDVPNYTDIQAQIQVSEVIK